MVGSIILDDTDENSSREMNTECPFYINFTEKITRFKVTVPGNIYFSRNFQTTFVEIQKNIILQLYRGGIQSLTDIHLCYSYVCIP